MLALLWPAALPLAAAAVLAQVWAAPRGSAGLWAAMPHLAAGTAALVGWRFNRGRVAFVAVAVVVAGEGMARGASGWVALLLPLNVVVFALLPERGVLSLAGISRVVGLGAQVHLVRLVPEPPPVLLAPFADSPLASPQVVAFGVAGLVTLGCAARRRGSVDSGLLFALAAMALALSASPDTVARHVYWTAAGLVLALTVVETGHALAFRDELTGLPGRRALDESLARLRGRYTLAMVDIDHFKKFNDKHGHDVGDQVLRLVAVKLSGVGGGGRAFRYGGEEFTLLFRGDDLADALPHIEALRARIADARFVVRGVGKRLTVRVSVGVAERARAEPESSVLARADKMLYAAKKAGRNRVAS